MSGHPHGAAPGRGGSVSGATSSAGRRLAAEFIRHGLVDECQLFVFPVVLGGGTLFFPTLGAAINPRLVESRTFDSGVVFVRYAA